MISIIIIKIGIKFKLEKKIIINLLTFIDFVVSIDGSGSGDPVISHILLVLLVGAG